MISIKPASHKRTYPRYEIDPDGDTLDQIEVRVEGEPVRLGNYSLGGIYYLSTKRFYSDDTVNVSIDIKNRGKIDLTGRVVQVRNEGDRYGIAIDFSKTYK
jgi:hypothetical protein